MSGYPTYLIHYGIQGQKWGVRRFQNEDGTWTSEGLERRKQLIESHAQKKDIRRATREGNAQVRYNKILSKTQDNANRKFDKITERIKNDRKLGINVSERDIKKAIRYGTEVRKADYIAKDPQEYYNAMRRNQKSAAIATGAGTIAFGVPAGILAGSVATAITAAYSNKKLNEKYGEVFEKARTETIADLKKRKLI